jgi:hypothetical protein
MWLPRWIASIVFLEGESELKDLNYEKDDRYFDTQLCESNLIDCARMRSFKALNEEETGFAIIFFIIGLALIPLLYSINNQTEDDQD